MTFGNFYLLKKYNSYKLFWLANFFSGLAVWMQNVASGTYASNITHSPFLISLIQVCLTLPVFIFSIPSGIVADRVSGYYPLLVIQSGMCILAIIYTVLISISLANIYFVLILTFMMGAFYAFRLPIGQANITKTIPVSEIKHGAILNNFGFNISRCIGPFFAGILYFHFSPSCPFIFSFLLFLYSAYLFYILSAKSEIIEFETKSSQKIKFFESIKLLRKNSIFIYMCFCSLIFFFLASGFWALLPYLAKYHLKMNSSGLGYITAAAGVGAIAAGLILPWFRNNFNSHVLILIIFIMCGISLYLMVLNTSLILVLLSAAFFGLSWAAAVALLNGEIQSCSPQEYRGRAISIYFLVMYFGLAAGGLIAGWISSSVNIVFSLKTAGCSLIFFGGVIFIIPYLFSHLKAKLHDH